MTYHAGESVVINIIDSAWIINTKIGSRSTYNGSDAIHNAFIYKIWIKKNYSGAFEQ